MADTFADRIAQAIGDPGSITVRQLAVDEHNLPVPPAETLTRWQTRAVLMVVSEHRWAPDADPAGGGGSATAVLLFIWCAAVFIAGVWLGSVWL